MPFLSCACINVWTHASTCERWTLMNVIIAWSIYYVNTCMQHQLHIDTLLGWLRSDLPLPLLFVCLCTGAASHEQFPSNQFQRSVVLQRVVYRPMTAEWCLLSTRDKTTWKLYGKNADKTWVRGRAILRQLIQKSNLVATGVHFALLQSILKMAVTHAEAMIRAKAMIQLH